MKKTRLAVCIFESHWALSLFPAATTFTHRTPWTLAGIYDDEETATRKMGELSLILMRQAVAQPTGDMRDVVISAVDIFMRNRAA